MKLNSYTQMLSTSGGRWQATILAIAVTAVTIVTMGQPVWCKCGAIAISSWDIWSTHNSQHLIDPYTFTHVLHGFVLFWCLTLAADRLTTQQRFMAAVLLECLWEIVENSPFVINRYRMATISNEYLGDSVLNAVSDIIACIIGYAIAERIRMTWSVAVFMMVELALLVTIRDGLILNVIMLLVPIDALKNWQMELRQ
jgi:hypothetical protein